MKIARLTYTFSALYTLLALRPKLDKGLNSRRLLVAQPSSDDKDTSLFIVLEVISSVNLKTFLN